jgi:hypothetical protein
MAYMRRGGFFSRKYRRWFSSYGAFLAYNRMIMSRRRMPMRRGFY